MAQSHGTTSAVIARSADATTAVRECLEGLQMTEDFAGDRRACIAIGLGCAAYVQPEVAVAVIEWVKARGVSPVEVIAVVPQRDRDAGWSTEALAARHDFPSGVLVDAWAVTRSADVGDGHVIQGHEVPSAWLDADLRIIVASCATDAVDGHALVLDALRHLPPTVSGADPADVVTDILQTMPPDVCVLDASVTSDGVAGTAVRRPLRTDTIVASTSAVLTDIIGATLLGTDAMRAPLLASVVAVTGLPEDYRIVGDLAAFRGISYPPEILLRATSAASVGRVLSAAMVEEGPAFDDDDIVLTYLRQQLRPYVTASPEGSTSTSTLVWSSTAAAVVTGFVDAFRTTFAKDSVPRRRASIGLDLSAFQARDYEAAEGALRPLLQLVEGVPADRDGLRWLHLDGAVVFEASRIVAAPFDDWIVRVDVTAAISMMADYLGGCVVSVSRDKEGRTVRQAERNIYLPQPNYASFSGGRVIDVCKLSVIRYRADSREIWWRTVRSPNESALYDDGTVAFSDAGPGHTRVVIRGRQHFTLPALLRAADLDLQPHLRDSLTEDAYRRFFSTTLDNFEACYEGRAYAIGQEPVSDLPTKAWSRLARVAGQSAKEWLAPADRDHPDVRVESVDDTGFTHVAGARR